MSFTDSLTGWPRVFWHILCGLAFVGAWLFPLMYLHENKWRSTEMGRHVMTFSIAVAHAITAYLTRLMFGEYPGRAFVMFSALMMLIIATWWRSIIYIRMRRRERRRNAGVASSV